MEDFNQQFRENMANRPEPEFVKQDWLAMEKSLEQLNRPPSNGFVWWWALLPLLFLLLGTNTYLLYQLKNTAKVNQNLASTEYRDTIYKTNITYITDTIYKTNVVYKTKVEPTHQAYASPYFNNINTQLFNTKKSLSTIFSPNNTPLNSLFYNLKNKKLTSNKANTTDLVNDNEPSISLFENIEYIPSLGLSSILYLSNNTIGLAIKSVEKKHRNLLPYYWYKTQPTGFKIGATAGFAHAFNDNFTNKPGYMLGLEANIDFPANLQMWLAFDYTKTSFETDMMGENGVPFISPPTTDVSFETAEVNQPIIQYSIGIQYQFFNKKKTSPYIGIGYGATTVLKHEIAYDFTNDALGLEWVSEKSIGKSELFTDFLLFRLGIQQQIADRWLWQLQSTYRTQLKNSDFQNPNLISLKTGFLYKF